MMTSDPEFYYSVNVPRNYKMPSIWHVGILTARPVTPRDQDPNASGKIYSWVSNQDKCYGQKFWLDNIIIKKTTPGCRSK